MGDNKEIEEDVSKEISNNANISDDNAKRFDRTGRCFFNKKRKRKNITVGFLVDNTFLGLDLGKV